MSDLSRMEGKIDAIKSDVADIKTNVAINTNDLKHHIKRTDLLEGLVKKLMWVTLGCAIAILGPQTPRLLELLKIVLQ